MKTYCVLNAVPGARPCGCPDEQDTHSSAFRTLAAYLGARPLSRQPAVDEDTGSFPEPLHPWTPKPITLSSGLPKTIRIVSQVCRFWLVSSCKVGALMYTSLGPHSPLHDTQ